MGCGRLELAGLLRRVLGVEREGVERVVGGWEDGEGWWGRGGLGRVG